MPPHLACAQQMPMAIRRISFGACWALIAACATTSGEKPSGFMFHHKCYNAISYALYFGTAPELENRMTGAFVAKKSPADLLMEFEARVARGRIEDGTATNIDGLLDEDVYDRVERVLFIPKDADKAAYIMHLKNTPDGCRLDDFEFR